MRKHGRPWRRVYSSRKRAEEYNALLKLSGGKWYSDMLGAAVQALACASRPPARILELGIGTGRLASRVLRRYPRARLYGLDGSPAMLEQARRTLRRAGSEEVEFLHRDFGRRSWREGLPQFDAAISTIAIHHLTDAGKRQLFRQVWEQLVPGGIFVHGDPVWAGDPDMKKRDDAVWAAYIQGRLKRLRGESRSIDSIVDWIDETRDAEGDKPASLEHQLAWLRDAGFVHVDCFWKTFGFAVFGGVKPAASAPIRR